MNEKPKIRDVAVRAGVSVSTISNYLNGRPDRMRPETVARIEEAIAGLGYKPSWAARQLKKGSVPVIGLLVPSVANPSHGALARAVQEVAEAEGYQVLLGNTLRDEERERRYADDFLALGLKGMILASSPFSLDHLAEFLQRGLAVVALDVAPNIGVDSISLDNHAASVLATEHLIALGHRRIGYVSGARPTASRTLRFRGYCDALAAAGITLDPALVSESAEDLGFDDTNAAESGQRATMRLLDLPARPTAILGMNDMHALGACAAIRERGLSVPDDISVMGIDDISIARIANPPLTTVHQPFDALAQQAVDNLIARMGDADRPPAHVVVEPQLVVRASVRAIAGKLSESMK